MKQSGMIVVATTFLALGCAANDRSPSCDPIWSILGFSDEQVPAPGVAVLRVGERAKLTILVSSSTGDCSGSVGLLGPSGPADPAVRVSSVSWRLGDSTVAELDTRPPHGRAEATLVGVASGETTLSAEVRAMSGGVYQAHMSKQGANAGQLGVVRVVP